MSRADGSSSRSHRDQRLRAAVPVGYLVMGFPRGESGFPARVTSQLARLHREQIIRVLDLVLVQKAFDGCVTVFEVDDAFERAVPVEWDTEEMAGLGVDVLHAMEPGSVAGIVVWEDAWAVALADRVDECGSRVLAAGAMERPRARHGPHAWLSVLFETDGQARSGPDGGSGARAPHPDPAV